MTEKIDQKVGIIYYVLGVIMMIIGFLILDNYLQPSEDLKAVSVFGYFMILNAGFMMLIAALYLKIHEINEKIKVINSMKLDIMNLECALDEKKP